MAYQLAAHLTQTLLRLDRPGAALHKQIYLQIREAVLSGELSAKPPLPSTRELAEALAVARSTVVEAFDQLQAEGYVETWQGAATRVPVLGPRHLRARLAAQRSSQVALDAPQVHHPHWRNDDPLSPIRLRDAQASGQSGASAGRCRRRAAQGHSLSADSHLYEAGISSVALSSRSHGRRSNGLLLGLGMVAAAEVQPAVEAMAATAAQVFRHRR